MYFDNIKQLLEYIENEELDLSQYNIRFIKEDRLPVNTDDVDNPKNVSISFMSLSDKPVMEAAIGDENILYVESFESIPNACGVGKIQFMGKTLLTNICEMDGESHITLPIDIDNKGIYNVTFKLKELSEKSDGSSFLILEDTLLHGKAIT